MNELYNRRTVLQSGGIGATALIAGCLDDVGLGDEPGDETYYIVAYHWGFAAFDEDGTEHELIEVPEGTELTIVAINDHASDAFGDLPEPVETILEDFDALERTKQHVEDGTIPEPEDATIEEVYEEAHDHAHNGHDDDGHDDDGHDDDGHDDDGHDDDGHDDDDHDDDDHDDDGHDENELTMLDHELIIPGYDVEMMVLSTADEPVQTSFVTDETGTFDFVCTHDCGYGHPYMVREMLQVE
ncbi:hypothetical protein OB919_09065 [Halobacteria archaeon AArc-curdl1]|uniref:Cytochrome oxidase subunit II copper A binding domain-containing protein n=1 Tax=Natronosalvus hydrolyticus TaxID=2979988 RepID=A0AAP2Z8U6_9EURY|nr:hypothetical protein [Halobacteria archaeon AArc-curdl1]